MAAVEKDFQVKKGLIIGSSTIRGLATSAVIFDTTVTSLTIGSAATATTVAGTLSVSGALTAAAAFAANGGTISTTATTFNLVNATATTVNFAGAATTLSIGATTGTATINNATLALRASNVSTTATTLGLFDATATTINFAGAATSLTIGATTGTTTIRNTSVVIGQNNANNTLTVNGNGTGGTATINSNVTTGTVSLFTGSTAAINLGGTGSTTTVSNLTASASIAANGGTISTTATTFNLVNATAATVNFAGAATTLTIGATTGTTTVRNSLTVTGNLVVNGTTTTVNSTTTTLDDPIITLGGDTPPAADDNKDRGVEFRYHNGTTAKLGFFGFDDSTGKFIFIPDATNTAEVFTGASGSIDLTGSTVLTIASDAGTAFTRAGEQTLTISGGVDLTGTASAGTVTIDHDVSGVTAGTFGTASSVGTFTVNSRGHITSASNTAIAITSAQVTDFVEAAQDAVAPLFTHNDHIGVSFVYDDVNNKIVATVNGSAETSTTVAGTTATPIYIFDKTVFRSGKLVIQASHATAGYQVVELLIVHNGTDAHAVEYANVFTGASALATYVIDIVANDITVTATPTNTNTSFKVIADRISV